MKKVLVILFFLSIFLTFTSPVLAQFKDWGDCVQDGVATLRCIPVLFNNVVAGFLLFVGAVSIFLIIYSGIKFITSGGDPKQAEGARKMMTYAIIGAVIVLSSFAIVYFIGFVTRSSDCITNIDSISRGGCQ